jgi:guanylate kinase
MSNEIATGPTGQGELFLLSAPSGAGKTTLIRQVVERLASHG